MQIKLFLLALLLSPLLLSAQSVHLRAAYNVGGILPSPMPASIRGIEGMRITPSFMVGADIEKTLTPRWGVAGGLQVEKKAMDVTASVKLYTLTMVRGGEELSGVFTGHVNTQMSLWMVTLPIHAIFRPTEKVCLRVGSSLSYSFRRSFTGTAYKGYLRQGDPTGPKISIEQDEAGHFDLSEEVRPLQLNITLGVDWYLLHNVGISTYVSYGLLNNFKSEATIDQKMHPLYGTIGICYHLKTTK